MFLQVYIITAPDMQGHETVLALKDKFSARTYQDSSYGEWLFAVMAPTLIGSFGTYTWMAAFLSKGHSIHLPYISMLHDGADWCPWHDLFIQDDPRIIYHDVSTASSPTDEAAEAVMLRPTIFASAIRQRKDPCPTL